VYYLQTKDGADIFVRARGLGLNVHHTFDATGAYAWLNSVTAYARGSSWEGGVRLDVWQVCVAPSQPNFLVANYSRLVTTPRVKFSRTLFYCPH